MDQMILCNVKITNAAALWCTLASFSLKFYIYHLVWSPPTPDKNVSFCPQDVLRSSTADLWLCLFAAWCWYPGIVQSVAMSRLLWKLLYKWCLVSPGGQNKLRRAAESVVNSKPKPDVSSSSVPSSSKNIKTSMNQQMFNWVTCSFIITST